jgi:hypothetical protein
MQVGELVRMQFYAQPMRLCCGKNPRDLIWRKSNTLAKSIDGISEFLFRDLRNQHLAKQVHIARAVMGEFRR